MTSLRKIEISEWLLIGFFLLTVLFSSMTVYSTSLHLMDGDSSAALVLAEHLHETGGILSRDWFYSTEICAVYTQLVYAPLFGLFEKWHMVRFMGTIILHAIYVASYGYMVYAAGMKRKAFWMGAALLLMPISVAYGRIVLYHAFYLVHITLGFGLVGSLLACMKSLKNHSRRGLVFHLLMLMVLSFLSSLNGYRQLAITHAPILLMGVVWLYRSADRRMEIEALQLLGVIGGGVVAACGGLLMNAKLHETFSFSDYSGLHLAVMDGDTLMEMLFGLFHQFGYRRNIPLLTRMGLGSVMALIVGVYCLLHSVRTMTVRPLRELVGERIIEFLLPCSLSVVVLVFLFTKQNVYSELYFLPYSVWFIPLLTLVATTKQSSQKSPKWIEWPTGRQMVAYALIGVCMLNGLFNMRSYTNIRGFNQPYEGLSMKEPDYTVYLTDVVDHLVEEGYDLGYCDFLDGNVITEMSDGKLKTVNLRENDGCLQYYDWLSLKSNRTLEAKKPFLLLKHYRLSLLENNSLEAFVNKTKQMNGYIIFDITDLEGWRSCIE